MAIQMMFSIKDLKSETFNPPFYQKKMDEAIRTFTKICNDSQSLLYQFPEDFVLILIGSFDDDTGVLTPQSHSTIGSASQYVRKNDTSVK